MLKIPIKNIFNKSESLIDIIEKGKGTGKYGVVIKSGNRKSSISQVNYFIEFKHLGTAINKDGKKYHNIIPINISCEYPNYNSPNQNTEFFNLRWIKDCDDIYWNDNNSANIRENAINKLLENK